MFGLSDFGLKAIWSPGMFVVITALALLYSLAVGPYRERWFKESTAVDGKKQLSMVAGLALFYIAQGGPLSLWGHLIFSAHMLSMSLSYLVVPPLIIYGTPDWMLRRFIGLPPIRKIFHHITAPILTLVLFNMLFSLYHMPIVFDYVMTHFTVHRLYYMVLFISAVLMWWNVVSPLPEYERLSDVKKMGYVFANGVLLTPACGLIIFADTPLYAMYSDPLIWAKALGYCVPLGSDVILSMFTGPEAYALFPTLHDQQLGGVLMKLMQEIMYGAILFYIFLRWFRRENPSSQVDPLDSSQLIK